MLVTYQRWQNNLIYIRCCLHLTLLTQNLIKIFWQFKFNLCFVNSTENGFKAVNSRALFASMERWWSWPGATPESGVKQFSIWLVVVLIFTWHAEIINDVKSHDRKSSPKLEIIIFSIVNLISPHWIRFENLCPSKEQMIFNIDLDECCSQHFRS